MGTIAARDALRIIELTETVLAVLQLALCQAVDLRGINSCHIRSRTMHAMVRGGVPINRADRRQDLDIAKVLSWHREGRLPIGEVDFAGVK
jgi:histidine ammonia-lyase